MLTTVKFRSVKDGPSPIISSTLGKIAVIDRAWRPIPGVEPPSAEREEFWLVDVVREAQPGKHQGCFIVRPVRCIAREQNGKFDRPLLYLLPGMYSIEMYQPSPVLGVVAIVTPTEYDGQDWILPLDSIKLISSIRNTYATVLNLGGRMWQHVRMSTGNRSLDDVKADDERGRQ